MFRRLIGFIYHRTTVRIGNRIYEATFIFGRCTRINPNPLY